MGTPTRCQHNGTPMRGTIYGYCRPVAVSPYTHEEQRAHGGVTYTETCAGCGVTRKVNSNGRHREYSPWGVAHRETN